MDIRETNKKIILYLSKRLGNTIEGKKKIMKLFFILEYIDLDNKRILSKPFLGNRFSIYHYGVYSEAIMKDIYKLINDGTFNDGFPLLPRRNFKDEEISLDKIIRNKLDLIIEKFGGWSGYKLEIQTLKILGLDLVSKRNYIGFDIVDILRETKLKTIS